METCQRAVQEAKVAYAQAGDDCVRQAVVQEAVQARTDARNQAWSAVMVLMEVRTSIMATLESLTPPAPAPLPDDARALRDQYLRLFYARELARAAARLATARAQHAGVDARYMLAAHEAVRRPSVDPKDADALNMLLREYLAAGSECAGVAALSMLVHDRQAQQAPDTLLAAADETIAAMEAHSTGIHWHAQLQAAPLLNARSIEVCCLGGSVYHFKSTTGNIKCDAFSTRKP